MATKDEFLKIDFKRKSIKGDVVAHSFEDGGQRVIYIPSLNISGYGNTEDEAKEMVNVCVKDFVDTLFSAPITVAMEEIKSLGWHRDKYFKQRFHAPYVDAEGVLREFDLSEETKIETRSMAVA